MALKIKLKPNEKLVINGCVVQNGPKRHSLTVMNFANIVRGDDLIAREEATTPLRAIYYAIQTLLINPNVVQDSLTEVQQALAKAYTLMHDVAAQDAIMMAANHVSTFDYYKALASLRPLVQREREEELAEEAVPEAAFPAAAGDGSVQALTSR